MTLALPKPEKFYLKQRDRASEIGLADPSLDSPEILKRYKSYLKRTNDWIFKYHRSGGSGLRVVHCRSISMDVLLENLFHLAKAKLKTQFGRDFDEVAILALGGYGRAELCPFSDVDIMFLYPNKSKTPDFQKLQKEINDSILYILWDLGLKVGHSTRTPKEAITEANADVQSKNAMLEARLICGSNELYDQFFSEYSKFIHKDNAAYYIEERLNDQNHRRSKFGNSPFLQEPDIKNGVGGLRDYQNILWMTHQKQDIKDVLALVHATLITADEARSLEAAYDFLLRVRNELHFQSKRPTDLLSLEIQPKVAWNLRYRSRNIFERVESFMRDYYKAAQTIFSLSKYIEERLFIETKTSVSFSEVLHSRRHSKQEHFDGFIAQDGVLFAGRGRIFKQDPVRLIRVFRHLQRLDLKMDFELRRMIQENLYLIDDALIENEEANKCFRAILQERGNIYPVLRKMNTTGVLSKFVPEWESLNCLVQHEYYHRYTADEHVLNTIQQCDQIFLRTDKAATEKYYEAIQKTEHPSLIYLILFLHDIGKGQGIEGHAMAGVKIAAPILERLGIIPAIRKKILFLIENHLEMARIWQRFDIDDPQTINSFAERIKDKELLRYLFVLTYCDAKGTADNLWNSYKDSLHYNFYLSTLHWLREDQPYQDPRTMISRDTITEALPQISEDEIEAHFNLLPDRYFNFHSKDDVLLHLEMIHCLLLNIADAESLGSLVPIVEWNDDLDLGLTVVHIVTWDRAGLFYKLAGAFTLAGLSIVSSKALSRADHITIDTFYVCEPNGGIIKDKSALSVFQEHLKDALLYNKDLMQAITAQAERNRKPTFLKSDSLLPASIPPKVEVYHELSLRRTILEIEANDAIGLLYMISRAIHDNGFDITFARISTEKHVAADTFYIEPIPSKKDDHSENLIRLRNRLLDIVKINDPTETP